jgi:hypothetical protein
MHPSGSVLGAGIETIQSYRFDAAILDSKLRNPKGIESVIGLVCRRHHFIREFS